MKEGGDEEEEVKEKCRMGKKQTERRKFGSTDIAANRQRRISSGRIERRKRGVNRKGFRKDSATCQTSWGRPWKNLPRPRGKALEGSSKAFGGETLEWSSKAFGGRPWKDLPGPSGEGLRRVFQGLGAGLGRPSEDLRREVQLPKLKAFGRPRKVLRRVFEGRSRSWKPWEDLGRTFEGSS